MPFAHRRPGVPDILYVMAAEQEYGPQLRARISPLMTGVGPVEAAVAVTAELGRLQAKDRLPQIVVSLGSAGSPALEHCGVYQASAVSYRDMDASLLGFEKGATPFLDLPVVVPLTPFIPGVKRATLSTGANVVGGSAYDSVGADMVDMETFAVLRACQKFGLPLIALRGISDGRTAIEGIHSWTEYLHVIDEKLAETVDILEAAIADGTLE
jgi:adenosylhomocysteine nucleosidase